MRGAAIPLRSATWRRRYSTRCCAAAPACRLRWSNPGKKLSGRGWRATPGLKRSSGRAAARTVRSSRLYSSSPVKASQPCISNTKPAKSSPAPMLSWVLVRSGASASSRNRSMSTMRRPKPQPRKLTGSEEDRLARLGRRRGGCRLARVVGAAGRDCSGNQGAAAKLAASLGFVIVMNRSFHWQRRGPALIPRELSPSGHFLSQYPTVFR